MKTFNIKNGTAVISSWPFWIFYAIAVGIAVIVILNLAKVSVEEASKIPPGLEDELILASRFYNSEKCFAYQDEFKRVHTKVINKSKFTQDNMGVCFPESHVKYAFSLTLSEVPSSINPGPLPAIDPIKTFNWVEGGSVTEVIEEVLIFDNDVKTRGTLIIEIKNVK